MKLRHTWFSWGRYALTTVVVCVLGYVYLPHILGNIDITYLFSWSSLNSAFHSVGTPSEVLASALALCARVPLLMATVLGLLVSGSFYMLGRSSRTGDPLSLSLIPALYLLSGYEHTQFLLYLAALLINITFFWGYANVKNLRIKTVLIPIVLVASFATTAGAYWFVVVLMVVDLLFWYKRPMATVLLILGTIMVAVLLPYVLAPLYDLTTIAAYKALWIKDSRIGIILFAITGITFFASNRLVSTVLKQKTWIAPAVWAIIIAIFTVCLLSTRNDKAVPIMLIEQAAAEEQWDEVLEHTSSFDGHNPFVTYLTNVALFRRGELLERGFNYPQPFGPNSLAIPWSENNTILQIRLADLAYANVGLINQAHRLAFEALASGGANRPILLKLLHYNRLLGRQAVADKFETQLKDTPFYDPRQSPSSFTPHVMRHGADSIYTHATDFGLNLSVVVATDPSNRGAIVYMAMYQLLGLDLGGLNSTIPLLQKIYNSRLPRVCNEAILMYGLSKNGQIDTQNLPADIVVRFKAFNTELKVKGLDRMDKSWHNSY